jgi:PDZ domain-containing secreted protein/Zn-dependent protease
MTGSGIRLFRVKGIPVEANWSWFVVVALLVWSLAGSLFPATYPGESSGVHLVMGIAAALALFGSIVLHELGHTLRALREGVRIRRISLWLFGGVAEMDRPFPTPGCELRVALAGPAVSGALAVAFAAGGAAVGAADGPVAVEGVASYVGAINALLLGFNLVPAVPLDGGRALHAWLWRRQGDRVAATLTAARLSRVFGVALVGAGLLEFLSGGTGSGVWIAFIGWFLLYAAQSEAVQTMVHAALEDLRVRQLMSEDPLTLPPDATLDDVVAATTMRHRHATYPVVRDHHLVGLLPWSSVADVPPVRRGATRVADVMLPRAAVPTVRPDQSVEEILPMLGSRPHRAVVLVDDEPVGMLVGEDVQRALTHEQEHAEEVARRRPPGGLVWLVVVVAVVLVVGYLYHPPYLVIEPGPSFDVRDDITITGVDVQVPNGAYRATTVRLSQPNLLGLAIAAVRRDREVVSQADVLPVDITASEYDAWMRDLFLDSRELAVAAAAEAAGYTATVTGGGATVLGTVASSPARRALKEGDVIVAVDGQPVQLAGDLRDLVTAHPAGTSFTLEVIRGGSRVEVVLRSAELPQVSGGTGLGVLADTADLRVEVPFTVTFAERPGVGGPSAGLAYALALADMLDPEDDARGRDVAATGTIGADGAIGPVGGVAEKAVSARDAGASVFVVPSSEASDADNAGLAVLPADTLAQALRALRTA